jgi:hypothetical protein
VGYVGIRDLLLCSAAFRDSSSMTLRISRFDCGSMSAACDIAFLSSYMSIARKKDRSGRRMFERGSVRNLNT